MSLKLEIHANDYNSLLMQITGLYLQLTRTAPLPATPEPVTAVPAAGDQPPQRICDCGTKKRQRQDGAGWYCPRKVDGGWCPFNRARKAATS